MYAFWTPFPPARTGTADYAAALVRLLSGRHRIAVVVADDRFGPATAAAAEAAGARAIPASAYAEIAREVALDVYFLANNVHHVFLLRRAERRRGVVVLHESSIEYAYRLLAQGENRGPPEGWKALYESEVSAAFPDHPRILGDHQLGISSYVAMMATRFLSPGRGAIVHSPVLATRLSLATEADVAFVPHPPLPPPPEEDVAHAWSGLARRLPDRPLLFGSLGFGSWYKRLPAVVEAYAGFARRTPEAAARTALVFAGDLDPHTADELARARKRFDVKPGRWVTLPYLSEPELQALLARLDLVVNLRYPSCGEASGMLTRSLEAGRPTLVSDHAYGGSLPDDVVLKIPVGNGEIDALAHAFARCASGERLVDPARVTSFARKVFDPSTVAARFEGHLEKTRERETLPV